MSMTPAQRAADAAAAASVATASASWFAHANEVVTFIAGVVAIIAGVFAIVVHIKRLRGKRNEP